MFESRLKKIRQKLAKEKLDAVLVSSVSNITYLTGFSNFSNIEREAYILIGEDFQYIITDGRYRGAIKKEMPDFTLFERGYKNSTESFLKSLKSKIKSLGLEEDNLTVAEHKLLRKHFKRTKHLDIKTYRSIKNIDEIKKIEKAAWLGDKAFAYILKKIKPGVSEKEIAFELEFFIKKNKADISFPPIVAFGKNSCTPHHQTGSKILENQKGQFVLLDFGVKLENYCSDMTRTVFFGSPKEKQKRIYKVVLEAQQKAINLINAAIKSGRSVKAFEVDKAARDYIVSKGYPTIPHSVGHGIGLEVHEHPFISVKSKEVLKEGMVFSIEPGIYLEGFGGVRIEDLFVLEKGKLRQITASPKNLIKV